MHFPKNPNSPHVYFDCDGTLVLWPDDFKEGFQIDKAIRFEHEGSFYNLVPNETVIEKLKKRHKSGATIVVWSMGGAVWAREIVTKLGIEEYVEFCLSKPNIFWDDEPAKSFMGEWSRKIPINPYE